MNIFLRHITFLFFIAHLLISSAPTGSLAANPLPDDQLNQTSGNPLAIIPVSEDNFILSSGTAGKLKNIQSAPASFIPQAALISSSNLESKRTYPLHNLFFNFPFVCYKFSISAYTGIG